jgi:hypothetical protein
MMYNTPEFIIYYILYYIIYYVLFIMFIIIYTVLYGLQISHEKPSAFCAQFCQYTIGYFKQYSTCSHIDLEKLGSLKTMSAPRHTTILTLCSPRIFPGLMSFCDKAAKRHYKGLTIDEILRMVYNK